MREENVENLEKKLSDKNDPSLLVVVVPSGIRKHTTSEAFYDNKGSPWFFWGSSL